MPKIAASGKRIILCPLRYQKEFVFRRRSDFFEIFLAKRRSTLQLWRPDLPHSVRLSSWRCPTLPRAFTPSRSFARACSRRPPAFRSPSQARVYRKALLYSPFLFVHVKNASAYSSVSKLTEEKPCTGSFVPLSGRTQHDKCLASSPFLICTLPESSVVTFFYSYQLPFFPTVQNCRWYGTGFRGNEALFPFIIKKKRMK